MDKLEMARALLSRSGAADPGRTATAVGVAASDSAGGLVRIDLGGDTVSPDDDQSIECETTFKVYAGDKVLVSLIGADGSGKTPIVVGVVGRGDQVQEDLDAVKNVKNYFWQDERGAHVSTEPNSVAGANILLDSDSLDIRQGEDDSEYAQNILASFGREVTVGSRQAGADVGLYSQVFGRSCAAKASYAAAHGFNTVAGSPYQTTLGRNNVEDADGVYALIVGNGEFPQLTETLELEPGVAGYALEQPPTAITDFVVGPITQDMLETFGITAVVESETLTVTFPHAYARDLTVWASIVSFTPSKSSSISRVLPAGETSVSFPKITTVETYIYFKHIALPAGTPTLSATGITSEDAAFWAEEFEGISATVTYEYGGTVARSNALTLDWEGNLRIAGGLVTGAPVGAEPLMDAETPESGAGYILQGSILDYDRVGFLFGATASTVGQGNYVEIDRSQLVSIFNSSSCYLRLSASGYLGIYYDGETRNYTLGINVSKFMVQTRSGVSYLRIYGVHSGAAGGDGTTFTPSVSAAGVISWTNNGGKENPQPVTIKGADGVSPTVETSAISGGTEVSITDADGSHTFSVMDGAKGEPGITVLSVTLRAASWSGTTLTVAAAGVTASNNVLISAAPDSLAVYTAARVRCVAQGAGTLTFSCTEPPASDLTVNVSIWGGAGA